MYGRSPPSFFLTKKNPAEAGEVDGLMKPSGKIVGFPSGNILLLGGMVPGINSMAQSTERWVGS